MLLFGNQYHKSWKLLLSLTVLALAACKSDAQEHDAGQAPPPPSVEVLEVTPRPVPVAHEYVGQTMGSREVEIHARVTGIIEQRLYEEGAPVEAGAPLFRIDPEPGTSLGGRGRAGTRARQPEPCGAGTPASRSARPGKDGQPARH